MELMVAAPSERAARLYQSVVADGRSKRSCRYNRTMLHHERGRRAILGCVVVFFSVFLGFYSTTEYVSVRGIDYIENGRQLERHLDVLNGTAGNPWQYRIFAPFLLDLLIRYLMDLGANHPVAVGFISFRIFQDSLILLVAFLVYRKLDLSPAFSLLGMAVLAWGMAASHYDSDLQFSTFFDVLFYLLAGLCVLHRKFWLIVPIMVLAALNRESSGLIPFVVLFAPILFESRRPFHRNFFQFLAASVVFLSIFVGLRFVYPNQDLVVAYGQQPGFDLLAHNLFRLVTWRQLIGTLSVIPLIAIAGYGKWRPEIRLFFWVVVPVWFVVHAVGSVMAESRLFLVPQALVFIPGALCTMAGCQKEAFRPPGDG
jgi:hypothetical protein